MNYLLLVLIFMFFCTSPLFAAELKFNDLPEKHWAVGAVYNLVKMGITSGYPDGTFRGNRNIDRYETAVLLGQLAKRNVSDFPSEKLLHELMSEWESVKYKIKEQRKKQVKIKNNLILRGLMANTSPKYSKFDYQLNTTFYRSLEDASFHINFDSMDAGWGRNYSKNLLSELIDARIAFQQDNNLYALNAGSGDKVHMNSQLPTDSSRVFRRPKNSFEFSHASGRLRYALNYVSHANSAMGRSDVSEFNLFYSYYFNPPFIYKLDFEFRPRYLFHSINSSSDSRFEFATRFVFSEKIKFRFDLGISQTKKWPAGLYAKFSGILNNFFNSGANIDFQIHHVGQEYRNSLAPYEFVDLNYFNRYILDGTIDYGMSIKQKVRDNFYLIFNGERVYTYDNKYGVGYPGTYSMLNGGVNYSFNNKISVEMFYQILSVPSKNDQFTVFSDARNEALVLRISLREI